MHSYRSALYLRLMAGTLASFLVAESAHATPTFPDVIAEALSLPAPPACSLCHEGATQRGTVTTPFGAAMRSRGLMAYDETSLRVGLMALEGAQLDTDGDGTPDIQELERGADPNAGNGAVGKAPLVAEYGCSSSRGGPTEPTHAWPWAMGAALLLCRARRARPTDRRR